jgi:hypothetical protein
MPGLGRLAMRMRASAWAVRTSAPDGDMRVAATREEYLRTAAGACVCVCCAEREKKGEREGEGERE